MIPRPPAGLGPRFLPLRSKEQLAKKGWELRCPACHTVVRPVPRPETKPLSTNSVHAVTKRDKEELCLAIGRASGTPTVTILRNGYLTHCCFDPRRHRR